LRVADGNYEKTYNLTTKSNVSHDDLLSS
jgi:hypothetical protein